MRNQPKEINPYRIVEGKFASTKEMGSTGAFRVPVKAILHNPPFKWDVIYIISDDGKTKGDPTGWEHVSVSVKTQQGTRETPTWKIMSVVKKIFWEENEVVMQLHPAEEDYVNVHSNTLHLWKPIDEEIPTPPTRLV